MRSGNDAGRVQPQEISANIARRGKIGQGSSLDPAVKDWIKNVFVPAMVRLYLADSSNRQDNGMNAITERVQ
jgi:hypothetical protein